MNVIRIGYGMRFAGIVLRLRMGKGFIVNWEIIGFEVVMAIFGIILSAVGIKLINVLNSVLNNMQDVSETMNEMVTAVKSVNDELVEARMRDKDTDNRLSHIERSLSEHIEADRNK